MVRGEPERSGLSSRAPVSMAFKNFPPKTTCSWRMSERLGGLLLENVSRNKRKQKIKVKMRIRIKIKATLWGTDDGVGD